MGNEFIKLLSHIYDQSGLSWFLVALLTGGIIAIVFMAFRCMLRMSKNFTQTFESHNKSTENLTIAIESLVERVQSPYLNTEQAVMIFREVMRSHVEDKIKVIGEILYENNIHQREKEVKDQIEREFRRITKKESETLATLKTTAGDMGVILQENVPWQKFLKEVNQHVFSDLRDKRKIHFLRSLMNAYIDKIVKIIEERGSRN